MTPKSASEIGESVVEITGRIIAESKKTDLLSRFEREPNMQYAVKIWGIA